MRVTRVHVLGLVAVLALLGAGAALAVSRDSRDEPRFQQHHRGPAGLAVKAAFGAAADYVGISRRELVTRLRDGQSLAEIAEAEGKSVDGLKQAIRAAITARLDAAIEDLVHRARAHR